jgi:hypothetical protein
MEGKKNNLAQNREGAKEIPELTRRRGAAE